MHSFLWWHHNSFWRFVCDWWPFFLLLFVLLFCYHLAHLAGVQDWLLFVSSCHLLLTDLSKTGWLARGGRTSHINKISPAWRFFIPDFQFSWMLYTFERLFDHRGKLLVWFDETESLLSPYIASIGLAGMVRWRKAGKRQTNFLSRLGVEVSLSMFSRFYHLIRGYLWLFLLLFFDTWLVFIDRYCVVFVLYPLFLLILFNILKHGLMERSRMVLRILRYFFHLRFLFYFIVLNNILLSFVGLFHLFQSSVNNSFLNNLFNSFLIHLKFKIIEVISKIHFVQFSKMFSSIGVLIISDHLFEGTVFNFRRPFLDLPQNLNISIGDQTIKIEGGQSWNNYIDYLLLVFLHFVHKILLDLPLSKPTSRSSFFLPLNAFRASLLAFSNSTIPSIAIYLALTCYLLWMGRQTSQRGNVHFSRWEEGYFWCKNEWWGVDGSSSWEFSGRHWIFFWTFKYYNNHFISIFVSTTFKLPLCMRPKTTLSKFYLALCSLSKWMQPVPV